MAMSKIKGLQMWCKARTEGYRDVEVKDMAASWKSGLAFCAIIHRFRPDIIDYDSLKKEDVFENNDLAFTVAYDELGIPALLEAADMVAMRVPDKLCVITYVAQYHNYFKDKPQLGGPDIQGTKQKSASIKRAMSPSLAAPAAKIANKTRTKNASMGDTCVICNKKVYLLERQIEGHKLYHRACYRSNVMSPTNKIYARPADLGIKPTPREKMNVDVENIVGRGINTVQNKLTDKSNLDTEGTDTRGKVQKYVMTDHNKSSESKEVGRLKTTLSQDDDVSEVMRRIRPRGLPKANENTGPAPPLPNKQKLQDMSVIDAVTNENKAHHVISDKLVDKSRVPFSVNTAMLHDTPFKHSDNKTTVPKPRPRNAQPKLSHDKPIETFNFGVKERPKITNDSNDEGNIKSGLLMSLANVRRQSSDLDKMLADNERICSNMKSNNAEKKVIHNGVDKKSDDKIEWQTITLKNTNKDKRKHENSDHVEMNVKLHESRTPQKPQNKIVIPPRPTLIANKAVVKTASDNAEKSENIGDIPARTSRGDKIISMADSKKPTRTDHKPRDVTKSEGNIVIPPRPTASSKHEKIATDSKTTNNSRIELPTSDQMFKLPDVTKSDKKMFVSSRPSLDDKTYDQVTSKSTNLFGDKDKDKLSKIALTPRPKQRSLPVEEEKLDWQLEATKRTKIRGGTYDDPEKVSRTNKQLTSKTDQGPTRPPRTYNYKKDETKTDAVSKDNTTRRDKLSKISDENFDNKYVRKTRLHEKVDGVVASDMSKAMPRKSYNLDENNKFVQLRDINRNHTDDINELGDIRAALHAVKDEIKVSSSNEVNEINKPVLPTIRPRSTVLENSSTITPAKRDLAGKSAETSSGITPARRDLTPEKYTDKITPARRDLEPEKYTEKITPARRDFVRKRSTEDSSPVIPAKRDVSPEKSTENSAITPARRVIPARIAIPDIQHVDLASKSPTSPQANKRPKRPAPARPPPPRRSVGSNRLHVEDIQRHLTNIDDKLTQLECRGRDLEDAIRKAGEEDDDKLMVDWFTLVNEKNSLVRDEADIIYLAREQELEDQQIEIDFKLRLILNKPDHQKTEGDLKEEEYLLTELLKVVEQRDRIVDSIDEDKQRYEEEDADISRMMKLKGFLEKDTSVKSP